MQTARQIERLWNVRDYARLARELLDVRPEASPRLAALLARSVPAAALALVRLDELSQAAHPLNSTLIRAIIAAQESDGGWGDPLTTALALRALLLNQGNGDSIQRGLAFLASLQKPSGIWPATSIPRTAEDPFASAFILFCLGGHLAFTSTARAEEATRWFALHALALDPETRRLWSRAQARCRMGQLVGVN